MNNILAESFFSRTIMSIVTKRSTMHAFLGDENANLCICRTVIFSKGSLLYNHIALLKEHTCWYIIIALLKLARSGPWTMFYCLLEIIENLIGNRLSQVDEPLYDSGS